MYKWEDELFAPIVQRVEPESPKEVGCGVPFFIPVRRQKTVCIVDVLRCMENVGHDASFFPGGEHNALVVLEDEILFEVESGGWEGNVLCAPDTHAVKVPEVFREFGEVLKVVLFALKISAARNIEGSSYRHIPVAKRRTVIEECELGGEESMIRCPDVIDVDDGDDVVPFDVTCGHAKVHDALAEFACPDGRDKVGDKIHGRVGKWSLVLQYLPLDEFLDVVREFLEKFVFHDEVAFALWAVAFDEEAEVNMAVVSRKVESFRAKDSGYTMGE